MDDSCLFPEFDLQRAIGQYTFCTDVLNVIGHTQYSCVYNGHDNGNGNNVAVKQLHKYCYDSNEVLNALRTLPFSNHHQENIMSVMYVELVDKNLWIILEHCPWNLETFCQHESPSTDERFELITQCMRGIYFLHTQDPLVSKTSLVISF